MILQFIQILIIRQIFFKMFICTECIQISENGISFYLSRIRYLQMIRICIHSHDLLSYFFLGIRQINTVTKGFTHLCFSIRSRKTATAFVLRNQRFRHNQCFSIYTVEFVYDLTALFDHRKLILTYRYSRCLKRCDICCLADRISKESYRNTCFKITHLDLRFNCWVSLKTGYRNQIHIIKRKFCQFRYL